MRLPAYLTKNQCRKAYEYMYTSRVLDEKMMILLKQGHSFFHIGCMGHEAIQVAAGLCLKPKHDWLFPYYRDLAFCLTLGFTPSDAFLGFLAREGDPSSNGRQMPQHYGHVGCNIPTSSSSTGTQFLQAVGNAFASIREKSDDVTVVCCGEGTTSQGDFHEALSWASREKAPVIFLVENNGYAISVPISEQRPGGKVSTLAKGYDGLKLFEVDGCDFVKSFEVMQKAVKHCRTKKGPVFIDASVVRLLPHSSSDDQKKYRDAKDLESDKSRDPVLAFRQFLLKEKIEDELKLSELEKQIKSEIDAVADATLKLPHPKKESAHRCVYSEVLDKAHEEYPGEGEPIVMVDAINRALHEEMVKHKKMLVFGQDVAGGKGGVFTATRNLTHEHGPDRCFNGPLAESSIIGVGIVLAMRGFKPVVEIQFGDYIWTAMMQIRNEVATVRYRSNGDFSCPMVIRVPVGGYIHGGLCQSQNIESFFAHIPGLKVVLPSTAYDAYGL